ncbi:hypothetical protein F558DRAFT_00910 [Streptomyces sp. AmelKG-A3]|nr:hypothetical protein [Streptomyces sp. SID4941]SCE38056.1 hypothetical protein GA0115247_13492 [Streptomyces sp. PalvLS-984]SDC02867.1 hypothetical protein F558DRAFT_00910 [Streptomyces sp. AmelKG-A3]
MSPRAVYRHVAHAIRHVPEGCIAYEAFYVAADCDADSGPRDEQEAAQDWALHHTGRSATDHGVPPKRDASKLSLRLPGDPLTRVESGTATHPARSRGSATAGRPATRPRGNTWQTTGSAKEPNAPRDEQVGNEAAAGRRWGRSARWASVTCSTGDRSGEAIRHRGGRCAQRVRTASAYSECVQRVKPVDAGRVEAQAGQATRRTAAAASPPRRSPRTPPRPRPVPGPLPHVTEPTPHRGRTPPTMSG